MHRKRGRSHAAAALLGLLITQSGCVESNSIRPNNANGRAESSIIHPREGREPGWLPPDCDVEVELDTGDVHRFRAPVTVATAEDGDTLIFRGADHVARVDRHAVHSVK